MNLKHLYVAGALTAGILTGTAGAWAVDGAGSTGSTDAAEAPAEGERCDRPPADGRRGRILRRLAVAAAESIGIEPSELRAELVDGGSIAEVATSHDVDPADVEAALVADIEAAVAQRVADGHLDAERAAEITDNAAERVHEFVTKDRPAHTP